MSARELRANLRAPLRQNSVMNVYASRGNLPFRSPSIASESSGNEVALFHPSVSEELTASRKKLGSTWLAHLRVLEITLSEPRDVLQSERTLLSFVRFSCSLYFAATGMIMGFHLRSSGEKDHRHLPNFNNGSFNKIMSSLLIALAFATLVLSGINYFRIVRRYSQKRIHTYGFNDATMIACVTAVVLTLIGINVALIVERIMQTS